MLRARIDSQSRSNGLRVEVPVLKKTHEDRRANVKPATLFQSDTGLPVGRCFGGSPMQVSPARRLSKHGRTDFSSPHVPQGIRSDRREHAVVEAPLVNPVGKKQTILRIRTQLLMKMSHALLAGIIGILVDGNGPIDISGGKTVQ